MTKARGPQGQKRVVRKTSVVVAGARTGARGGRSNERDRYGRIVGKVLLDGIDACLDACLEQVKAGFAWHYKKYQHEQSLEDQRLYAEAETKARNERLGLWRENNPNPPWDYRRLYR